MEPLGAGGMGEVWRGLHVAQGLDVAVKVVAAARAADPEVRRAFVREVRAVAALDHPGVVVVLEHGEVGDEAPALLGRPFLAMELASGVLRDGPGASWSTVRAELVAILDALAHAHARGVVHLDLKPANVLRFEDGRLALADFGLAHRLGGGPEALGGTPQYMAPEQFRGAWRDFGPWTDLYALGCLAWERVTGRPPFLGTVPALRDLHTAGALPPLKPLFPVPEGVAAWLRRLLAKEPGARPGWAADAAASLPPATAAAAGAMHAVELTAPALTFSFSVETPQADPEDDAALGDAGPRAPVPGTWRADAPPAPSPRLVGAGISLFGLRQARLIDRHAERDALWSALRDVDAEGRPRAIVLRGQAGTGKSRLAEWLCERAHEVGAAQFLRATYSAPRAAGDGLLAMVEGELRLRGLGRTRVAQRLGTLLPDLSPGLRRHLVDLLRPAEGQGGSRSAAEGRGVVAALIAHLGRRRPVVLWLDDVQWGAEARSLVPQITGRVLVVLTHRADVPAPGLDAVPALRVDPLAGADARALVDDLLGLRPELVAAVEERVAGNPLFAVQLVGDWVRRGLLEATGHGFRLRAGASPGVPDALHALWVERVDRALAAAPAPSRTALELAAVLGRQVDLAEWREACAIAAVEVPDAFVAGLEREQLVEGGPRGWAFAHGLLVESLLRKIEEQGDLDARSTVAAQAVCAVARRRREIAPVTEAVDGYERAFAIAPVGSAVRAVARVQLGECLRLLRRLDEAEEALVTGRDLAVAARDRGTEALAVAYLGAARLTRGDVDGALRLFDEAVARARAIGDAALEAVVLGNTAGAHRRQLRPEQAEGTAREAIAAYRSLGNRLGEASVRGGLALVLQDLGRHDEAEVAFAEAATALEGLDALRQAGGVLANHGILRATRGDLDGARVLFDRALALHRRVEDRVGEAVVLSNLGTLDLEAGHLPRARAVFESLLALYDEIADPSSEVHAWLNLAVVAYRDERPDDAARCLERALAVGPDGKTRGVVLVNLAVVRANQGRRDEAEALIARGLPLLSGLDLGEARLQVIPLLREWGRDDEAAVHARAAVAELAAGHPGRLAHARRLAAELGVD